MIFIGGHRGLGCTDSAFAQARNARERRVGPAENTLESLTRALRRGASFIETDVVATADEEIALTHANDVRQHVFVAGALQDGRPFIDEMTLAEVQRLPVGPNGDGRIPSLRELLRWVRHELPGGTGAAFVLNLELKGVQATPRPSGPSLASVMLRVIDEEKFPLEWIRFSSFSMRMLEDMAAREPRARLGMLYTDEESAAGRMFVDSPEAYRVYTADTVRDTLTRLPGLEAVHPEIRTLTTDAVALCAEKGLAIAAWASYEDSPETNPEFATAARQATDLYRNHGVHELCLITDYLTETKWLIGSGAVFQ